MTQNANVVKRHAEVEGFVRRRSIVSEGLIGGLVLPAVIERVGELHFATPGKNGLRFCWGIFEGNSSIPHFLGKSGARNRIQTWN